MTSNKNLHYFVKNFQGQTKRVLKQLLGTNSLKPFGFFLLVIGVTAGLFLVQTSTELRDRAAVDPYVNCGGTCKSSCSSNESDIGLCSGSSSGSICCMPRSATPTSIAQAPPTSTPSCIANGQVAGPGSTCCSGHFYQSGNNVICGSDTVSNCSGSCFGTNATNCSVLGRASASGSCGSSGLLCCGNSLAMPTSTRVPTSAPTSKPICLANGQVAGPGSTCCAGVSYQSGNNVICGTKPASTCSGSCIGSTASNCNVIGRASASGSCGSSGLLCCGGSLALPTSTPVPTSTPICLPNGQAAGPGSRCCSGVFYQSGNNVICGSPTGSTCSGSCIGSTASNCGVIGRASASGSCGSNKLLCCGGSLAIPTATPTPPQIALELDGSAVCAPMNGFCDTSKPNDGCCSDLVCRSGTCRLPQACDTTKCLNGCDDHFDSSNRHIFTCKPFCKDTCFFGCEENTLSSTGGTCKTSSNLPYCPVDIQGNLLSSGSNYCSSTKGGSSTEACWFKGANSSNANTVYCAQSLMASALPICESANDPGPCFDITTKLNRVAPVVSNTCHYETPDITDDGSHEIAKGSSTQQGKYCYSCNTDSGFWISPQLCAQPADQTGNSTEVTQLVNQLKAKYNIIISLTGSDITLLSVQRLQDAFAFLPPSFFEVKDGERLAVVLSKQNYFYDWLSDIGNPVEFGEVIGGIHVPGQSEVNLNADVECHGDLLNANCLIPYDPTEVAIHEIIHANDDQEIQSEFCGIDPSGTVSTCTVQEAYNNAASADGVQLYAEDNPDHYKEKENESLAYDCSAYVLNPTELSSKPNIYKVCNEFLSK